MSNFFYDSDGARLAYYDACAGIPVIFLHPTPVDHVYWIPLSKRLHAVRVIAPDFRGHGASALGTDLPVGGFARVPDAPVLTVEQLARDTFALLDHLHLKKAVFAGCSIGGSVLLELWRQAPERVLGLAFICAKPQPDSEAGREKRVATIAQARAGKKEALFDGMARNFVGATTQKQQPQIVSELRARMTISAETLVAVQAGLALRPDSVPTVATVKVPVLAVAGGEDAASTPAEVEAFRAAPGGCQFHVLPEAGHFGAYEQPDAVAALLNPWLQPWLGA